MYQYTIRNRYPYVHIYIYTHTVYAYILPTTAVINIQQPLIYIYTQNLHTYIHTYKEKTIICTIMNTYKCKST